MPGSQEKRNGVGHRSFRRQRDSMRKKVEREGLPCHLCGLPINVSLPYTDPGAFTADHIDPISKGGSLHKGEIKPAHRSCNSRRGNKGIIEDPPVTKLY